MEHHMMNNDGSWKKQSNRRVNGNRVRNNGNSVRSNGNSVRSNGNGVTSNGNGVTSNGNGATSNGDSNGSSKVELAYEALTMLQETLDAYGIVRKEKVYGKTLRVSVQNKTQLQKINDVIELILVTEEINIEEIGFPEWPNEKKFMLYIKGSPHHEIESVFAQTDMKWRISEVDHKLPENENEPYIYKFDNSIVLENEKNKANRQLKTASSPDALPNTALISGRLPTGPTNSNNGVNNKPSSSSRSSETAEDAAECAEEEDNDDFLEAQYTILVKNTMMKMQISKKEAENQIQIWFQWRTQDEKNNERLAISEELNTMSEIKKYLNKADTLHTDNIGEPQDGYVPNLFQDETDSDNGGASSNGSSLGQVVTRFLSRSPSRIGCCLEDFSNFYILSISCLKKLILVSLIILLYFLYTNEKRSSNLKNNIQEIF
jgi:hypothetical protein